MPLLSALSSGRITLLVTVADFSIATFSGSREQSCGRTARPPLLVYEAAGTHDSSKLWSTVIRLFNCGHRRPRLRLQVGS